MGYASWPVEADVVAVLDSFGAVLPDGFDVDAEVMAVVAGIERRVGFGPALAAVDPATVVVELEGSASRVVTLSKAFVAITDVSLDGVDLASGSGWWTVGELPWRALRLGLFGSFGRLSVTGRAGLFEEVPEDLWSATRDMVAGKAMLALESAAGGGLKQVRQDSVSLEYVTGGISGASGLVMAAEDVIERWSTLSLGGG